MDPPLSPLAGSSQRDAAPGTEMPSAFPLPALRSCVTPPATPSPPRDILNSGAFTPRVTGLAGISLGSAAAPKAHLVALGFPRMAGDTMEPPELQEDELLHYKGASFLTSHLGSKTSLTLTTRGQ